MTTYYCVEKAEYGSRLAMTGATDKAQAEARLHSIARNLQANDWLRTDSMLIRKLPVIVLAKDNRVMALMVAECDVDGQPVNRVALADMDWLTRVPEPVEASRDYTVTADMPTPTDGLFAFRDGKDTQETEVAQNG